MIELDENYLYRFPQELSVDKTKELTNPELIICDEVTSALDQIIQEEILKLKHIYIFMT